MVVDGGEDWRNVKVTAQKHSANYNATVNTRNEDAHRAIGLMALMRSSITVLSSRISFSVSLAFSLSLSNATYVTETELKQANLYEVRRAIVSKHKCE